MKLHISESAFQDLANGYDFYDAQKYADRKEEYLKNHLVPGLFVVCVPPPNRITLFR